jgi:hypothetical protein
MHLVDVEEPKPGAAYCVSFTQYAVRKSEDFSV